MSDTVVYEAISRIIDEQIRPTIALDGGTIVFVGYENGIVRVSLSGACQTCPMSLYTLKYGVEQTLRDQLPHVVITSVELSES